METKLSFDDIKKCVIGAEKFLVEGTTLQAYRFTEEEQNSFLKNPDFHRKTFSNSNMIISFFTDAEKLILKYRAESASSRRFAFLDVKVNGFFVAHYGTEDVGNTHYGTLEIPLPGSKSKAEIFLPHLARVYIEELTLVNSSLFQTAPRQKRIVSYGDSITQGYDAKYPLCSYTAILAEELQAELINKAIGGDIFNPALALAGTSRSADLVTVAYGTNDWSKCSGKEEILANCEKFIAHLTKLYPHVPIAAILPIWRKDHDRQTASGNFFEIRQELRKIMDKYSGVYVIDGLSLTPHVEDFYSDRYLHPNDPGFMFMGHNLVKELKKSLPGLWK